MLYNQKVWYQLIVFYVIEQNRQTLFKPKTHWLWDEGTKTTNSFPGLELCKVVMCQSCVSVSLLSSSAAPWFEQNPWVMLGYSEQR